jgi:WD40 repeat protein
MHFPRKTSSSCIVHLNPYLKFAPQQDAPRHSQVCYFACACQLKHRYVFPGHSSPILSASFSPTGNQLATGSGDTNARLWDLNTETPSHVLSGHKGWVLCVEWEAMERKLATGGHDGHVSLFMQEVLFTPKDSPSCVGTFMGSEKGATYRRSTKRPY